MSISILTPYKLFFITQADILYALMKDGRVLKIKQTPYFSNISSDKKILSGISFDGENTHIFSLPFGFDLAPKKEIVSLFGYFYYPCLAKENKKMAVIEADLLKPRPQGELRIYTRKIKKWYLNETFEAKMRPPFISQADDSLFFIDKDNFLMRYVAKRLNPIAEKVQIFALSPTSTKLAYWQENKIFIYSLLERKEISSFPASCVTALTFDTTEKEIIYATSQEKRNAIYSQNYVLSKTSLLVQSDEPVVFICT